MQEIRSVYSKNH